MAEPDPQLLARLEQSVLEALAAAPDRLLVLGICGAQGSGKSTLAAALEKRLSTSGLHSARLSLDDLYLTREQRQELGREVHPLLATRGVPGTHDVALGLTMIAALERGEAAPLPRFDKGTDDRAPPSSWPTAPAGTQVLLLEGWCLGARPQDDAELAFPVNALERDEDPDATWRRYANSALGGDYQVLFARIDLLVLLAAPDWSVVAQWREEQEAELRAVSSGAMSPAEVSRFIQHYERLTRWILTEMPARAHLVIRLDADRGVIGID